jgi:hypothetical protein
MVGAARLASMRQIVQRLMPVLLARASTVVSAATRATLSGRKSRPKPLIGFSLSFGLRGDMTAL